MTRELTVLTNCVFDLRAALADTAQNSPATWTSAKVVAASKPSRKPQYPPNARLVIILTRRDSGDKHVL